jgi:RND family efflux transporter MFP subunit
MQKPGTPWFITLILSLLGPAGCGREPEPHVAPPLEVVGTPHVVQDTQVVDGFRAAGVAEPIQQAMLASRLMARVTELLVREGDQVIAGQVLARLDARDLTARAEQAAAGLFAAEAIHREALAQAQRIRALYADSAAPRAQLDRAEAGLAQAESAVRQARAAAAELEVVTDYATVRAPFAGTITQRLVDPGSFAAPGQPLLEIEDQSVLRIVVTAAPDAVVGLRRGQTLTGDIAGRVIEAVIEGIVPAPDGHLATVNATVRNPGGRALAGTSASLLLPRGTRPGRLVPEGAVIVEGDLTGVYLRRGGTTELRWVRLGQTRAGLVEVLSGLAAGDTVLVPAGAD